MGETGVGKSTFKDLEVETCTAIRPRSAGALNLVSSMPVPYLTQIND